MSDSEDGERSEPKHFLSLARDGEMMTVGHQGVPERAARFRAFDTAQTFRHVYMISRICSETGKISLTTHPWSLRRKGSCRVHGWCVRTLRPTFWRQTCTPHRWPKSIKSADVVVALLIIRRPPCSDFPNSIPVPLCAIGRLHPSMATQPRSAPRWSCIEARVHQILDKCC